MASKLELAVILTTYQRPRHLALSLASLTHQRGMDGKFEVVVADDGSQDNTHEIVRKFAETARFLVTLATHAHDGFRVALCRNDGVRASTAPYLLFTDGDCLFPPDHLYQHNLARRPRTARAGSCYRLDQETTERLDAEAVAKEMYRTWLPHSERLRLFQMQIKDRYYELASHPTKPKLTGWNIGISREDLDSVNGFDENFVGWGCEDDDIAFRLRKSGVRIASALRYTSAYHMWHPLEPTQPAKWTDGLNVERLQHVDRPIRCQNGLTPNLDTGQQRANTEDSAAHQNRPQSRVA